MRRGVTIECLKDDGKLPEDSERLTIRVMVGRRTGRHFLRSQVGIGSRSHCLFGDRFMSLRISTSVAGVKEEKSGGRDGGDGKCGLLDAGIGWCKSKTKLIDFVGKKGCK